jgi:hypothetical protein
VITKTMQAVRKSEESPRKQNKAPARSVIKNDVAEGHILKKTRQANRQSGGAFRRQHNAPTRSVIKKTMQAIQSQKNLPENKAKPQQGV